MLSHTYALLVEEGFGGASIDEISRRSGVAKTTIYRHWPTRTELLLDACAQLGWSVDFVSTGAFESDIRVHLVELAQRLQTEGWTRLLPSILDAAERDPDVAEVQGTLQQAWAAPIRRIVEAAVDRGEISSDADPDTIAALALGPLYYRRWFSRQPIDSTDLDVLIGTLCIIARRPV
ncbi:TetR/AcrR family transcriptional regulator [Cryobacterium sp. TMT4-31]|uniref:TetR/AcrR family transcriptional regulator n=1 Tax=Cryobacterium sp. TMT4-31 TaxID=1259259 RepID=UPI0018E09867|nr:TetR/AcrR family transcriptional regulator [Cryobacterium sp. TMT4-31]